MKLTSKKKLSTLEYCEENEQKVSEFEDHHNWILVGMTAVSSNRFTLPEAYFKCNQCEKKEEIIFVEVGENYRLEKED